MKQLGELKLKQMLTVINGRIKIKIETEYPRRYYSKRRILIGGNMNKTAVKNFAVWARRKLISEITYKAGLIGINDKGISQPLSISTGNISF